MQMLMRGMVAIMAITSSAPRFSLRGDWLYKAVPSSCSRRSLQMPSSSSIIINLRNAPASTFFHQISDANNGLLLKFKPAPQSQSYICAAKRIDGFHDSGDEESEEVVAVANAKHKKTSSIPKYSKAARRFYNDKFRKPERLSKILAAAGVSSRRGSEEYIFAGRVAVNGMTCSTPQILVDPFKDTIHVDGISLPRKLPPKLYFAVNKPKGYICSSGEDTSKSVLSLLDPYMKIWRQRNPGLPKPRLFTVGRLDVATSGLILITNDGEFAQKVAHPSSGLTKEYIVCVEGRVTRRQLKLIIEGTVVDGVHCAPVSVELLGKDENKERLRIVVSEGRNHEVRHLVGNAGVKISALKRVRIGNFALPSNLRIGMHCVLSEADIKKLLY